MPNIQYALEVNIEQVSLEPLAEAGRRLTCHGDLALGAADGPGGPAQGHQHRRLGGLPLARRPLRLLPAPDQGVPEEGGGSQATAGVLVVRLDGHLRAARLVPGRRAFRYLY